MKRIMNKTVEKQNTRSIHMSQLKTKTLAVIAAVAAAVVLPQIVHVVGRAVGAGSGIGEMLLPMHLPVLFLGLLMGPAAGAVAGMLAPLASYALTGMPGQAMLPYIMIELMVYGLVAGSMSRRRCHCVVKLVVAQICGRIARSLTVIFAIYVLGSPLMIGTAWTYITAGLCGILVQLLVLPVLMQAVEYYRAKRGV